MVFDRFKARTEYFRNSPSLQRMPGSQREWVDFMQELSSVIHEGRSGTFTPTFTGFSSDPAGGKVYWAQSGSIVTLAFETQSSGTSNLTTFGISNLPDDLGPNVSQVCPIVGLIDNNVKSWGAAVVYNGTIAFGYEGTESASWTNSGTKGLDMSQGAALSITYNLVL